MTKGTIVKRKIKTLVIAALWPLCLLAQDRTPANAGSSAPVWNELKGDPARGAEAFVICQGCHKHGATGTSSGAYPRLAGQHATVLIEQMTDIRSGARKNPKMERFSDEHVLTTQEIADIAAYVQALPIPPNLGRGPGNALERGKALYVKDCASCHGDQGEGKAENFYPLVAGQHYKYLLREARYIRDGSRGNANPDMVKVIKSYSDDDLEAVSDYMSGLVTP